MSSSLPPRRRDTVSVEDRVLQDRQNLKQLGVGFVGGRNPLSRPLGSTSQFGDLEENTGEDGLLLAFRYLDRAVASTAGTVTLNLTYTPVDGSLRIAWNGIDQPPTEWTLSGTTVTFEEAHIKVGDVLSSGYAYYPGDIEESSLPDPGAWYRFDEVSGALMSDSSGNGHNGSYAGHVLGQPSLSLTDPTNTSCAFVGSIGRGEVGYGSWMDTTAISATILVKGTSGAGSLISRDDNSQARLWSLRLGSSFGGSGGALGIVFGGIFFQPVISAPGTNFADNVRHMAGFSFDGSTVKLYADGVLKVTQAVSGSNIGPNVSLMFGACRDGGGGSVVDNYNGTLDEGRIYPGTYLSDTDHADAWNNS